MESLCSADCPKAAAAGSWTPGMATGMMSLLAASRWVGSVSAGVKTPG